MAPADKFAWMKALRGADLTHAEYRVLINLSTWANGDLTNARPGFKNLCEAAKVRPQTAQEALRKLIEKGWIEVSARGGGSGRSTVYTLTVPAGMGCGELTPSTDENPHGERAGSTENPHAHRGGSPDVTPTVSVENPHGRSPETPTVSVENPHGDRGTTRSDQITTPGNDQLFGHLSNAGAGARGAEQGAAERTPPDLRVVKAAAADPGPDPYTNPMAWLDRELPFGGFHTGERARAEQLLAEGVGYATVKYTILRERHASRPARRIGRS
ncbi:MarR family winged helix-turn-helix transcriptional regulator [Nocardia sp. NPDC057227]|uniref:MarR family winged helix-turn-helix transcriptional regulator n=1 Tax=Nocardia sp. NPDC057227 TaxID=3346056 RepID=UPI003632F842